MFLICTFFPLKIEYKIMHNTIKHDSKIHQSRMGEPSQFVQVCPGCWVSREQFLHTPYRHMPSSTHHLALSNLKLRGTLTVYAPSWGVKERILHPNHESTLFGICLWPNFNIKFLKSFVLDVWKIKRNWSFLKFFFIILLKFLKSVAIILYWVVYQKREIIFWYNQVVENYAQFAKIK